MSIFIITMFVFFAEADIKFENDTKSLVGLRMHNNLNRVDSHKLLQPGEIFTYENTPEGVVISTQIINGSYVVNCCEWLGVQDSKKVTISKLGDNSERCKCVIK